MIKRELKPGEVRRYYKGQTKIYTRTVEKGKYPRNESWKKAVSARMKGKVSPLLSFTNKDRELQNQEVDKMTKALTKQDKKELGKIPDLKMSFEKVYAVKLQELKSSNTKGAEEIAKMESLVFVGQSAMQYLLDLWVQNKDKMNNKAALKFRSSYFNKWHIVNEELRRTVEGIFEMKYGKTVHLNKDKGRFEEELEKMIDVTPDNSTV